MNDMIALFAAYLMVIFAGAFFIWDAFNTFKVKGPTFTFAVDVMLVISMIVNLVKLIMSLW